MPDLVLNIKNEQKLQNSVYHSQFLRFNFDENFIKTRTKIPKLQMHKNLHENVNENIFSFTFLRAFS